MALDMSATFGGAAAGFGGIVGNIIGGAMNRKNVRETNEQNERLMREGWARDDTKHQRTVEDLRAAGLNPILAAGGGTSNSAPVTMQSSKPGEGLGQSVANAGTLAISGYGADISREQQRWQQIANMIGIDESLARAENIRAQTGSVEAQTALSFINELLGKQTLKEKEYDFNIAKGKGMPSNLPFGPVGISQFNAIVELLKTIKAEKDSGQTGSFGITDFIKKMMSPDVPADDSESQRVKDANNMTEMDFVRKYGKPGDKRSDLREEWQRLRLPPVFRLPDPEIGNDPPPRRNYSPGSGSSATRPRNSLK